MEKNIQVGHIGHLAKIIVVLLICSLIFTISSCKQDTGVSETGYAPPQDLNIKEFSGSGAERAVHLVWKAPSAGPEIIQYAVYKFDVEALKDIEFDNEEEIDNDFLVENAEEIARTDDINYKYIIGSKDYCFYVTAIYDGDIESSPSNVICPEVHAGISPGAGGTEKGRINDYDEENGLDKKEEDTESQTLSRDAAGLCYSRYYPAVSGASHTYQVTGTHSWTQPHTIADVTEEGFTEEVVQKNATRSYEWECTPEGLINTYGGIMITGTDIVTTSSEGEGVTIPASISIGDTWTQTRSLISSDGKGQGELHWSVTFNRTAAAIETITVPAGTFEAIRVDYDLEMDASLETHDGHSLPLYVDYSSGSEWYVKDVGLVKKTVGVELDKMDTPDGPSVAISLAFSGVYELMGYSLP